MGEQRSPDSPPSRRPASSAARQVQAAHRRIFREMVKHRIQDRPLSRRRRHELIRFARRLDMDEFEARLLVRAVEYECGHVMPAAMDERHAHVAREYLAGENEDRARLMQNLALSAFMAAAGLLLIWLI